jgi:hypothetical protein
MVNKKCIPHNRQLYRCVPCGGKGICEHNIERSKCKPCGGSQICEHERLRSRCKECGGTSICKHEKRRGDCKECGDKIHITIKHWISHSKQSDKKYNRYDETNYIDYEFCKELIKESGKFCYYCDIELQYIEYNSTLATIERLDNDIGHIKENCVIACRTCNLGRVGDKE